MRLGQILLQKTTWMGFTLPLNIPLFHPEAISWYHPACAFLVQL